MSPPFVSECDDFFQPREKKSRLCNSPVNFKSLMEKNLHSIPLSVCVMYLDNILMHAASFDNTLANLH
ncbi:hypothetical protein AAFF_G00209890 [Aldrovandia affinis]|uniref:Reverse transcriptase n=1 Tax=Aldrovandia affinis TaxID=143900 RepID=A0AAD7WUX3_9TELE|nr:hypothetical protein AAFF_G00209890 [Aldrovandia affinis]